MRCSAATRVASSQALMSQSERLPVAAGRRLEKSGLRKRMHYEMQKPGSAAHLVEVDFNESVAKHQATLSG